MGDFAGTEPSVGADDRILADMGAGEVRERADRRALLHRDAQAEHDVGLDRDVLA